MQSVLKKQQKQGSYQGLGVSELLAALAAKDQILEEKDELLQAHQKHLNDSAHIILEQGKRISLLEEYLGLVGILLQARVVKNSCGLDIFTRKESGDVFLRF
jgi:hypothetical protein